MFQYIARRTIQMVPVVVLVSIVAFSLLYVLPGDPALAVLGEEQARNREAYQQRRAELGLDRPLPLQYFDWAGSAVRGDLGNSTRTREPVLKVVGQRLAPTLLLGIYSLGLACLIAIPAGILSAIRPNSKGDIIGTVVSIMGASIPNFWLGILLILMFAVWLPWLPIGGYASPLDDPVKHVKSMIMPTFALGTAVAALVMRQTRSAVLEVIREDYIRTARAKGLRERVVLMRHTVKNAMIPVVTVIGLQVGNLMGGAVITETIFSVPGIGSLASASIFARDYPVLQGVIVLMALSVMVANLLADITYSLLDPRIRYR
jgi:peptide/nickel transport system permease protein